MKHIQLIAFALLCGISTAATAKQKSGVDTITLISSQPFDRAVAKVNFVPFKGKPHHGFVEISPVSNVSKANLFAATTGICKYVITGKGYEVKKDSCGSSVMSKYGMNSDNIKTIQIAEIRVGKFVDRYFEQGTSGSKKRPYGAFAHSSNRPLWMKGTTARKFKVNGHRIVIAGQNR